MVFVSDSVSTGTDSESRNRSRSRLGRIMSLGLVSELQNLVSSVSAVWIKMRALEMFGTFMPSSIMIGGLIMSSFHLTLHKDHFDILYVRFGEGHVGPDEGFGDVWDILASAVHDKGLEMAS